MSRATRYCWGLALLLQTCANPTPPAGGPRDEQPPQLDSLRSTANYQTRFQQTYFELTFDEWVVLEKEREQVVVSPPLDYELSIHRKTVRFDLQEGDSLRANTTYTVNFGAAIQDLTEGNPAENMRFVFSTGDVLDSLSISGQLYDVATREAIEGAYFMLYDNLSDTVVATERPYYFGRTDEAGRFTIENLRAGTFRAFAMKAGAVAGYLYKRSGEQIGFPDTLLELAPEVDFNLQLPLFVEQKPLRFFNASSSQFGLSKLLFNQPPPDDLFLNLSDSVDFTWFSTEVSRDTLLIWYNQTVPASWSFILERDSIRLDTVTIPQLDKEALLSTSLLQPKRGSTGGTRKIAPGAAMQIDWNHPIAQLDLSRMRLSRDTVLLPISRAEVDSLHKRQIRISAALQQDSSYQLTILPGAIVDLFGLINEDTITSRYQIGNLEDYGNIAIRLTGLDSTRYYRGELRQGDQVLEAFFIDQKASFSYEKRILSPKKYTIRIIEDRNHNQKWDTGDYETGRQPEPIYTKELESLRANWDLEETINLPDLEQIIVSESPGGRRNR